MPGSQNAKQLAVNKPLIYLDDRGRFSVSYIITLADTELSRSPEQYPLNVGRSVASRASALSERPEAFVATPFSAVECRARMVAGSSGSVLLCIR